MKRILGSVAAALVGLVAYSFVLGPLRNTFDDRWPYINTFLAPPGVAARNVAVLIGLIFSVRSRGPGGVSAPMLTAGFACLLIGPLMNALYDAWALDHRTQLQQLIFDQPSRLAVWNWYFWLEVPQLIAATGFMLLLVGIFSGRLSSEPTVPRGTLT